MFISIVLNTEYWSCGLRSKWYLKNLLHCKENGWILITHEYLWKHFEEIQKDITPRLFNDFEMRPFVAEEVNDVEQYFLSDKLFEQIEKESGSRTAALEHMVSDACPEIEHVFDQIIEQIKIKHPNERIEGMFNCLENFQFLRNISGKHDIPLVSYSFSAIRRPHGYRQTLYHTGMDGYLYTSAECKARYSAYLQETADDLPVFTNEEIIAIIGKDRTLPLLPLINVTPKYEMGICGESFAILPQFFNRNRYTDDDIFYECSKLYKKDQVDMRHHAAQLDLMRISRDFVHNDPAPYILSCKRLTAVRSQIMLKVLLWKRVAIVMKDTLAFSFMCAKDYTSNQIADIKALNYYIFGFLIPSGLMFSDSYWKWRMTSPTEHEIYRKHLDYILNELAISLEITSKNGEARLKALLESRHISSARVEHILKEPKEDSIDWNACTSKYVLIDSFGNEHVLWCLNSSKDGIITSEIPLCGENVSSFRFVPCDDIASFARIRSLKQDGKEIEMNPGYRAYHYLPKGFKGYEFALNNTLESIVIEWQYESEPQYLKNEASLNIE